MTSYDACNLCKRTCTAERRRGSCQGKKIWYEEDRTSQEKDDTMVEHKDTCTVEAERGLDLRFQPGLY